MPNQPRPVIAIPCCTRLVDDHVRHFVSEKYILAASEAAGGMPFPVPALAGHLPVDDILRHCSGILLSGSSSNVEPHHYGSPALSDLEHDPARDALTLPLIRAAVAADVPILAICRGIQELNAALGGTLHQQVHAVPGRLDHRERCGPMPQRYEHSAHKVHLTAGGLFEHFAQAGELLVNSLHQQGIDRLAPGLAVEAVAPDGQIEGVSMPGADFVVGVQWHPEFRAKETIFGQRLFTTFGAACRRRAAQTRAK